MTTKPTQLKPCPFCGNRAKLCKSGLVLESDRYRVQCSSADCGDRVHARTFFESTKQEVADIWNMRRRKRK